MFRLPYYPTYRHVDRRSRKVTKVRHTKKQSKSPSGYDSRWGIALSDFCLRADFNLLVIQERKATSITFYCRQKGKRGAYIRCFIETDYNFSIPVYLVIERFQQKYKHCATLLYLMKPLDETVRKIDGFKKGVRWKKILARVLPRRILAELKQAPLYTVVSVK